MDVEYSECNNDKKSLENIEIKRIEIATESNFTNNKLDEGALLLRENTKKVKKKKAIQIIIPQETYKLKGSCSEPQDSATKKQSALNDTSLHDITTAQKYQNQLKRDMESVRKPGHKKGSGLGLETFISKGPITEPSRWNKKTVDTVKKISSIQKCLVSDLKFWIEEVGKIDISEDLEDKQPEITRNYVASTSVRAMEHSKITYNLHSLVIHILICLEFIRLNNYRTDQLLSLGKQLALLNMILKGLEMAYVHDEYVRHIFLEDKQFRSEYERYLKAHIQDLKVGYLDKEKNQQCLLEAIDLVVDLVGEEDSVLIAELLHVLVELVAAIQPHPDKSHSFILCEMIELITFLLSCEEHLITSTKNNKRILLSKVIVNVGKKNINDLNMPNHKDKTAETNIATQLIRNLLGYAFIRQVTAETISNKLYGAYVQYLWGTSQKYFFNYEKLGQKSTKLITLLLGSVKVHENPFYEAFKDTLDSKQLSFSYIITGLGENLHDKYYVLLSLIFLVHNRVFQDSFVAQNRNNSAMVLNLLKHIKHYVNEYFDFKPEEHVDLQLTPATEKIRSLSVTEKSFASPNVSSSGSINLARIVAAEAVVTGSTPDRISKSLSLPYPLGGNAEEVMENVTKSGDKMVLLYTHLSILTILINDHTSIDEIQNENIYSLSWMSGRPGRQIPLGSAIMGELIDILHKNLVYIRDSLLHQMTLFCLLTCMINSENISVNVVEKIFKFYEMVSRRMFKLVKNSEFYKLSQSKIPTADDPPTDNSCSTEHIAATEKEHDITSNLKDNFNPSLSPNSNPNSNSGGPDDHSNKNNNNNNNNNNSGSTNEEEEEDYSDDGDDANILETNSGVDEEFLVYYDLFYTLSYALLYLANNKPTKNVYLIYEMVRRSKELHDTHKFLIENLPIVWFHNQRLHSGNKTGIMECDRLDIKKVLENLNEIISFVSIELSMALSAHKSDGSNAVLHSPEFIIPLLTVACRNWKVVSCNRNFQFETVDLGLRFFVHSDSFAFILSLLE